MFDKKLILALLVLSIFGALSYLVFKEPNDKNIKKLKVAYQSEDYINASLITLAENEGYFRKEGLEIETDNSVVGTSIGLVKGDIDVAVSSTPAYVVDYLNDRDIIFLSKLSSQPPYHGVIKKKGKINDMSRAAVIKLGGTAQIYTEIVAQNLGIKEVEYVVAPIGAPQIAALKKNSVDFIVANIYNKVFNDLRKDPNYEVIPVDEAWGEKLSPSGIMTTKSNLNREKREIKAFVRAMNKAQRLALNNPDLLKGILVSDFEISDETATGIIGTFVRTATLENNLKPEEMKDVFEHAKDMEPKNRERSIEGFIDNSLK